ncbi:hypothetical protein WDU94_006363 [Cyamophila willieti]
MSCRLCQFGGGALLCDVTQGGEGSSIRTTRRKSKHPQHNIHAMSGPAHAISGPAHVILAPAHPISGPAHAINTMSPSNHAIASVQDDISNPDIVPTEQTNLTNDTTNIELNPDEEFIVSNPICTRNEDGKFNPTNNSIRDDWKPRSHLSNGETFRQLSKLTKEMGRVKNPWLEEYIAKFKGFKQENDEDQNVTDTESVRNNPSKRLITKSDEASKNLMKINESRTKQQEADFHEANESVEDDYNPAERNDKIKMNNEEYVSNNNNFPELIDRSVNTEQLLRSSTEKRVYSRTSGHIEDSTTEPRDTMNVFVDMLNKFTSANVLQTNNLNRKQIHQNMENLEGYLNNEQSTSSSSQSIISKSSVCQDYLHRERGKHSAPVGSKGRSGAELGKFQGTKSGTELVGKFPGPNSAYKCHKCGNSYARLHSLSRHVKFECGVAPKFECFICHKRSKHKHNLLLHMKTHTTHK